jgi:hypothetical protein
MQIVRWRLACVEDLSAIAVLGWLMANRYAYFIILDVTKHAPSLSVESTLPVRMMAPSFAASLHQRAHANQCQPRWI